MFDTLLIANRGEIACRIIRTARAMGYRTVAVFSDSDRQAPHVLAADVAVHIGASPAAQSYLNVEALLQAAQRTGAHAIHPGYGFLSENADFAQACKQSGLVFVGPPPEAIAAMGNKASAKQRMVAEGVPCAPGYFGAEQSDAALAREAVVLGFPLLVKAVAGGGGRGMRLVHAATELQEALESARREAQSAFGDSTLMLERLIDEGRHIEVQIFADAHGHAIHLGERDCTTQRRRQKIIEECPSPVVTPELREAMGRDAVTAALAVGYQGAGTVEFIVDAHMRHYFLEMNTRLQVEHPVTELVTGLDLVEWQLRIAAGEPLPLRQEEVQFVGHAIEARLCAEDPGAAFAPQTGRIVWWRPAQAALPAGVRIDDGVQEGDSISPHYDPMVAKVIAHGRDRADAMRRLRAALQASPLLGVKNNAGFLRDLLVHPDFIQSRWTTRTLDHWQEQGAPCMQPVAPTDDHWCMAAVAFATRQGTCWRANSVAAYDMHLQTASETRVLRVQADRQGLVRVSQADKAHTFKLLHAAQGQLRFEQEGMQRSVFAVWDGDVLHLGVDAHAWAFSEMTAQASDALGHDPSRVCAPVAGTVKLVRVSAGDVVVAGQPLVCVEAMKMEMWQVAAVNGRIVALGVQVGDSVSSGQLLVDIAPDPA